SAAGTTGGNAGTGGTSRGGTTGSAGVGGTGGAGGRGGTAGGTAGTAAGGTGGGNAGTGGGNAGTGGGSGGGGSGGGTLVVINFDDQADGPLSPTYKGIAWDTDWYVYHQVDANYRAHSGTQFITNLNVFPELSFAFPTAVHFQGAWFSHVSGATIQLEAFDAAGTLIGASPTIQQTLTPVFLPLDARGAKKITVVFQRSSAGDDFAMDDVTYIVE
ncbi:MAG TPA: hypothetical protein VN903_05075, partial [Polyangia bacterium]|nr:hypothetical protein [Polyangia bacterium]